MFKTPMDKVLIVFTVVLAIFMAFSAGVNTQAGQWLNAISASISGLFFVGIVWAVVAGRISSLIDEARRAAFKEVEPALDRMVEAAQGMLKAATEAAVVEDNGLDEHEKHLTRVLMETTKHVLNGEHRAPTAEEVLEIQRLFTEVVGDHAVRLTLEDHGIAAEFMRVGGKIPVERVEGDEPRPVATHATSEAKPLTKSQQRRLNAQKGLGALTDDEVREAKNEKRRAARAAKVAGSVQVTRDPETTNEVESTLKEKIAAK